LGCGVRECVNLSPGEVGEGTATWGGVVDGWERGPKKVHAENGAV